MKVRFVIILAAILSIGFAAFHAYSKQGDAERETMTNIPKGAKTATFAGGCFWCSESDLEKAEGVIEVISGYTGGDEENPTYKDVSYGRTSHYENCVCSTALGAGADVNSIDIVWQGSPLQLNTRMAAMRT